MDSEERARKEHERVMRAREKLKFRVYAAVRDAVLATDLFRAHSQLYEPDIVVNIYPRWVDVTTVLTEVQVRLLPVAGRTRVLHRFAEQLRAAIAGAAKGLELEFTEDPARWGGSQPVLLVDIPTGYRAVLLRSAPE